ncbi:unnamed protein product [Ilex paraguariensis]|uniref:GDSL esterase/lipase n=1 Tax=Ilex paraguariensis TaxID=185542 RepID=A0ABC8R3L9_9AQUA
MSLRSSKGFAFFGHFLVVWVVFMATFVCMSGGKCNFEGIFNFGDSNSDTGGFFAAFPPLKPPYGMTYFKKPAGRLSDGRLVIDFLGNLKSEALGLSFLSSYLQTIGSYYRHGANFATAASTVLLPNTSLFVTGISPFSLAIQLSQMKQFKGQVEEYYKGTKGATFFLNDPPLNSINRAYPDYSELRQ